MEFGWSEAHQNYRKKVQAFIKRELPENWYQDYAFGVGSVPQIDFSRKFCAKLAEEDLLLPHWPVEYGGRDAEQWEQFILAEEMKMNGEPRGPQYMNVNWLGPTLMKFGTPAQKKEHLARIATGTVVWCQGYSEPGAGTDLAALQTKAVREGDDYIVNGSKIWTSYAGKADWCFLLVRTGPERKNISILLVPMDTPGISVVPMPGLVENGHLHEVFLTDVRVPVTSRIGEEGKAWDIITYALSYERVGIPRYQIGRTVVDYCVKKLKAEGRLDAHTKDVAARIVAKFEAARLLTYVVVDERAKQRPPSVVGNIARLAAAEPAVELLNFIFEHFPDAAAGDDPYLVLFIRGNLSSSIAAGAYEIQLNLIAQRALNLPRE